MKLLIISNVWVEPSSSAAGSRMLQLIHLFLEKDWELTYATTANPSVHAYDLSSLGVAVNTVLINDESFDTFVKALAPDIVLFDRFMCEEQFGWRIADSCPKALRILDTEDLHCLRKARHQSLKEGRDFREEDLLSEVAKREIASIYRCDLSLMISDFEMELLTNFFKVPEQLLYYLPFLLESQEDNFLSFEQRSDFVAIGNFVHAPNWDATLHLKEAIWPLIRKVLPQAQLYVYGAYISPKVEQLHYPTSGFHIMGRAENAHEEIQKARILLAPLRFGAGIKGKFIDAMQCGTPSITTTIGAEGMRAESNWPGAVEDDVFAFAEAAVSLYSNKIQWREAQLEGVTTINTLFQKTHYAANFREHISHLLVNVESHRLQNFTGQMLQHHSMRSTKYMSKWIAEKNKA